MQYGIVFLEGTGAFFSPAAWLLPVWMAAVATAGPEDRKQALKWAGLFSLGFAAMFGLTPWLGPWLANAGAALDVLLVLLLAVLALKALGALRRIPSVRGNWAFLPAGMLSAAVWIAHVELLTAADIMGDRTEGALLLACFGLGVAVPLMLLAGLTCHLGKDCGYPKCRDRICGVLLLTAATAFAAGLGGMIFA